jgi:hypothetical protein
MSEQSLGPTVQLEAEAETHWEIGDLKSYNLRKIQLLLL